MRCLSYALHTAGLSYALALPRCITLAVDFLHCSFQRLKQGHLDVQVVAATVAHTDVSPQVGFVSPSWVSEIPVKKVLASQCHNVLLATIISDEVTGQMRSHLLFVFCGQYVVVCVGLVEHGWWLLQIFAIAFEWHLRPRMLEGCYLKGLPVLGVAQVAKRKELVSLVRVPGIPAGADYDWKGGTELDAGTALQQTALLSSKKSPF